MTAKIGLHERENVAHEISHLLTARHMTDDENPDPCVLDFNRVMFSKAEWKAIRVLSESASESINPVRFLLFSPTLFGITSESLEFDIDSPAPRSRSPRCNVMLLASQSGFDKRCEGDFIRPPRTKGGKIIMANNESVEVAEVHTDCRAYKTVKDWAVRETKLGLENKITYDFVETLIYTASTWKQLHRWCPQLVSFIKDLHGISRVHLSTKLSTIDGSKAHKPPKDIEQMVEKYSRFAMARLLQANMIRKNSGVDKKKYKRALYEMHEGAVYLNQHNIRLGIANFIHTK